MAKLEMKKEKYSSLDGRTKVRFVEEPSTETRAFQIEASPSGLRIQGTMSGEIETMEELQAFAKLMGDAWVERNKLKPQLVPG